MSNTDPLAELEHWLAPLLANLSPAEVRKLTRSVAATLRGRQSARIAAQANPDGSPYAPRVPLRKRTKPPGPAASQRTRVKAMFAKLRTAKYLKASGTATEATVQFVSRVERIAAIHHFGLKDRPQPSGPEITYPERQLLGWADGDIEALQTALLKHLTA